MLKGKLGLMWVVVGSVGAITACFFISWISFWATVSGMKSIIYDGNFTVATLEASAFALGILVQYGQNPLLFINQKTDDKNLKFFTGVLFWTCIFFDASTNVISFLVSQETKTSPYAVNYYVSRIVYFFGIVINLALPFIEEVAIVLVAGLISALKGMKYGESKMDKIKWEGSMIPDMGIEKSDKKVGGGMFDKIRGAVTPKQNFPNKPSVGQIGSQNTQSKLAPPTPSRPQVAAPVKPPQMLPTKPPITAPIKPPQMLPTKPPITAPIKPPQMSPTKPPPKIFDEDDEDIFDDDEDDDGDNFKPYKPPASVSAPSKGTEYKEIKGLSLF